MTENDRKQKNIDKNKSIYYDIKIPVKKTGKHTVNRGNDMSMNIVAFSFENHQVRFSGEYPVAIDIARALGYSNPSEAIKDHIDIEYTTTSELLCVEGNTQKLRKMIVISDEAGIYQLIFGSKLESAKKFQKWVFEEVLPSIRKQGYYGQPIDPLQAIANKIQSLEEENQLLKAKTRLLEAQSQPDFSKLQEMTQHLAQSNPEMLAMMVEKFAIACYEMGRKKNKKKKFPEIVLLPENIIDADDIESLLPILEYIKQNNGEITTREICRKFNRKFIVDGEVSNMNSKVAYRIMEILAIAGYGEIIKTRRNSIKFEIFATFA